MIRDAARDFAQAEIVPIAAEFDASGEFPVETIRMMGEMGLMGIEVPEKYGGAGLDPISYTLAIMEISAADAAHGTIMSVNNTLYCNAILKYGNEEQKHRFVTPIASGKAIGAYALTESQSGSDAANMRSRAVLSEDGTHYVINARKSWITSGPVAKYILPNSVYAPRRPVKSNWRITTALLMTVSAKRGRASKSRWVYWMADGSGSLHKPSELPVQPMLPAWILYRSARLSGGPSVNTR